MAVSANTSGIYSFSGTSGSTSMTTPTGTNRVILLIMVGLSTDTDPVPDITSIVRNSLNFVEITSMGTTFDLSGDIYRKGRSWAFYMLDSAVGAGSGSTAFTMDSSVDALFVGWYGLVNAYQGEPYHKGVSSGYSDSGPTSGLYLSDTQTGGLCLALNGLFNPAGGGAANPAFINLGVMDSPLAQATGGAKNVIANSGASDDGISSVDMGWTISGVSAPLDWFMPYLEVNTYDWTPPVAVPEFANQSFCSYVQDGQIRKMVSTVSGLDHLEGEAIQVQMDGDVPRNEAGKEVSNVFTVSSGSITLPKKAAVVHSGLGYEGLIKLLKTNDGSQLNLGQTKMRRVFLAILRLRKTLGLSVGVDDSHLNDIFTNTSQSLFSGDKKKLPQTTWKEDTEFVIKQTRPLPAYILAAILRSEVEEKL